MADPASIDIYADRNVDLSKKWTFLQRDLTGFSFLMQVRKVRDTTGTPLADLAVNVGLSYAGTATVAAHVTAGRLRGSGDGNIYGILNPATGALFAPGDSLLLSQIHLDVDFSVIQAFPVPDPPGADLVSFYDIMIEQGSSSELLMRGQFVVRAGVTRP